TRLDAEERRVPAVGTEPEALGLQPVADGAGVGLQRVRPYDGGLRRDQGRPEGVPVIDDRAVTFHRLPPSSSLSRTHRRTRPYGAVPSSLQCGGRRTAFARRSVLRPTP